MHFGYTILYVRDVLQAIDFYERAFGCSRGFVADDGSYGELGTGETTLSFAAHDLVGSFLPGGFRRNDLNELPPAVEIGFVTNDVATAWETALAAGATPLAPPMTKPWGQTVAYVRDPEGMLVELCTPVGG
ncbi:MAG: VOC family protein [Thermomicrobiales bacterium]